VICEIHLYFIFIFHFSHGVLYVCDDLHVVLDRVFVFGLRTKKNLETFLKRRFFQPRCEYGEDSGNGIGGKYVRALQFLLRFII